MGEILQPGAKAPDFTAPVTPDQKLTHILELAEYARRHGFVPLTVSEAVRRWKAISPSNPPV